MRATERIDLSVELRHDGTTTRIISRRERVVVFTVAVATGYAIGIRTNIDVPAGAWPLLGTALFRPHVPHLRGVREVSRAFSSPSPERNFSRTIPRVDENEEMQRMILPFVSSSFVESIDQVWWIPTQIRREEHVHVFTCICTNTVLFYRTTESRCFVFYTCTYTVARSGSFALNSHSRRRHVGGVSHLGPCANCLRLALITRGGADREMRFNTLNIAGVALPAKSLLGSRNYEILLL